MMGLTSHLLRFYEAISSYRVSFSSMIILTTMVLGLVHLVRALFRLPLKIMLVVSVAQNLLVLSVDYFPLVVSVESFHCVESQNPLVV